MHGQQVMVDIMRHQRQAAFNEGREACGCSSHACNTASEDRCRSECNKRRPAGPAGPAVPFASVTQGLIAAATGAGLTLVFRRSTDVSSAVQVGQSSNDSHQVATAATATVNAPTTVSAPPPPSGAEKPANDVFAGAMARAASQSTIHPLDTMKVRMQAGKPGPGGPSAASKGLQGPSLPHRLAELRQLYKGVAGAATGAGIIIGTYFCFYSSAKRFLKQSTELHDAGAAAAVGSSFVKVPLAVCIRSVQAGVYPNVFQAASSITAAAGVRGLFTGFLPTLLEDVPDMAVKFAVYETLRHTYVKLTDKQPGSLADLLLGGTAGAAAAAATTPVDVVKTVMMCNASSRPTITGAVQQIAAQGKGAKVFFRGVGPRALSNGLNSAIFFCFFEAFRHALLKKQQQQLELQLAESRAAGGVRARRQPVAACLSLAVPLPRVSTRLSRRVARERRGVELVV